MEEKNKKVSRKIWKTPKLKVHGDIEKITKEGPNIGPDFARGYADGSLG